MTIRYFKRKNVASWAAVSGEAAVRNYSTDDNYDEITQEQFIREAYADEFDINLEGVMAAGSTILEIHHLDNQSIPFLTDAQAAQPITVSQEAKQLLMDAHGLTEADFEIIDLCPACGEPDCDLTCVAFTDFGDDPLRIAAELSAEAHLEGIRDDLTPEQYAAELQRLTDTEYARIQAEDADEFAPEED